MFCDLNLRPPQYRRSGTEQGLSLSVWECVGRDLQTVYRPLIGWSDEDCNPPPFTIQEVGDRAGSVSVCVGVCGEGPTDCIQAPDRRWSDEDCNPPPFTIQEVGDRAGSVSVCVGVCGEGQGDLQTVYRPLIGDGQMRTVTPHHLQYRRSGTEQGLSLYVWECVGRDLQTVYRPLIGWSDEDCNPPTIYNTGGRGQSRVCLCLCGSVWGGQGDLQTVYRPLIGWSDEDCNPPTIYNTGGRGQSRVCLCLCGSVWGGQGDLQTVYRPLIGWSDEDCNPPPFTIQEVGDRAGSVSVCVGVCGEGPTDCIQAPDRRWSDEDCNPPPFTIQEVGDRAGSVSVCVGVCGEDQGTYRLYTGP